MMISDVQPQTPLENSLRLGAQVLNNTPAHDREHHGQFLTPASIARFMGHQLAPIPTRAYILDPAVGAGTLLCALIEQVVATGECQELFVDGFDIDPRMCQVAREALSFASHFASQHGVEVHARVIEADFILHYFDTHQPALPLNGATEAAMLYQRYDYIIANPPYFKLPSTDRRAKIAAQFLHGSTNIYVLFLAIAARLLTHCGRACFIIPRSFCSGAYFSKFRRDFLRHVIPIAVHVFESRSCAFKSDEVLQENVIFTFRPRLPSEQEQTVATNSIPSVSVSHSQGSVDLSQSRSRQVAYTLFTSRQTKDLFLRVPLSELDEEILRLVDTWTGSLTKYGFAISTGPVVPFRARSLLTDTQAVLRGEAVPLLWMQNVQRFQITWPTSQGNKPQGLRLTEHALQLLVPAGNYVLLRRFSAKEDARRLVAAPFICNQLPYTWLGLENHLNYIYRNQATADEAEVYGLAALLNSAFFDRYFRIINGTTQVNATELRALPLPPLETIQAIGEALHQEAQAGMPPDLDVTIFDILRSTDQSFAALPAFKETRIKMGKIQEAQDVLQALGLPKAQQNELSALTLLVLAQLSEEDAWADARRQSLGIHSIMIEMAQRYDRRYAENTRESIRRQVVHQFEQAGLIIRNPDDPTLATSSPPTHYALSDETIRTIRLYGTAMWEEGVATFHLSTKKS